MRITRHPIRELPGLFYDQIDVDVFDIFQQTTPSRFEPIGTVKKSWTGSYCAGTESLRAKYVCGFSSLNAAAAYLRARASGAAHQDAINAGHRAPLPGARFRGFGGGLNFGAVFGALSRGRWVPYSPDDPAWAPDKSPDKRGSYRYTGTPPGDLVQVAPVEIHGREHYLPGVYVNGRWLSSERAYALRVTAQRKASEQYRVQKEYEQRSGRSA